MTTNPRSRYVLYQAEICGIDRWQLMHEYAQKSTSTTFPRRLAMSSGALLSHWEMPLMSGAGPQFLKLLAAVSAVRELPVLVCDDAAQVEFVLDVSVVDALLQCGGVIGDRALQHGGQVEHQRHREQDHRDATGDPNPALPATKSTDPLGDSFTGKREDQQWHRDAYGEGRGQSERRQSDRSGGTGDDDRRKHRPCARHEQQPEHQTQAEAVACGANLSLRDTREGAFEQPLNQLGRSDPDPIETSRTSATQRIALCGK